MKPIEVVARVAILILLGGWGQARSVVLYECWITDVPISNIVFPGPGDVQLSGALLGSGPVGVVISSQSDNQACRAIGLARALVERGFRVLLFEYGSTQREEDTVAAARELARQGVKRIILLGASQGGKTSIIAATRKLPGVVALVTLSAEFYMPRQYILPYAQKLELPTLFITAQRDAFGSHLATPKFYRVAQSKEKQLVIMPGNAHGFFLLKDPRVMSRVLSFIESQR